MVCDILCKIVGKIILKCKLYLKAFKYFFRLSKVSSILPLNTSSITILVFTHHLGAIHI